jgi:hypothetical protein
MTAKQLETEAQEVMLILESACNTSGKRSTATLEFAKQRGIEHSTIISPDGSEHSAAQYTMQVYCTADTIAHAALEEQESYQILALLNTLEKTRTDHWGYGSRLNYDLRTAGIRLRRDNDVNEIGAFMAQKGNWKSNYDKGKNMEGNMLAVAIYSADLIARCRTLVGQLGLPGNDPDPQIAEQFAKCLAFEDPIAVCESLIQTFVPAYLGQDHGKQLAETLCGFLRSCDYYYAPASTKYHGALYGGLAVHSIGVTCRMFELMKPTALPIVGKIVLCGLCHDLCKVNFYKRAWRNRKVYTESGDKREPDGSAFEWVPTLEFEIEDQMPIGHGVKSAYMLNGVMDGKLSEEVAAAIVGHMNDVSENPECELLFMEQPLALYLHIADNLESQIDAPIYEELTKTENQTPVKHYPWTWFDPMGRIYQRIYNAWRGV